MTQTIAAEGQGRWKEYVGGYSDWLETTAGAGTATLTESLSRPSGTLAREGGRGMA